MEAITRFRQASIITSADLWRASPAISQLVAFILSGSGSMLSEAIHSAADTGNQALLRLLSQAGRAPTRRSRRR